jgi:hypothetical protein
VGEDLETVVLLNWRGERVGVGAEKTERAKKETEAMIADFMLRCERDWTEKIGLRGDNKKAGKRGEAEEVLEWWDDVEGE